MRRLIFGLLVSAGLLIGISSAEPDDQGPIESPMQESMITFDFGQNMTGVDNVDDISSGLQTSGTDSILLSGNIPPISDSGEDMGIENSGTLISGEETTPDIISDPIPILILSEVYYDGTDEWIEITNIGEGSFQGNIMLAGVKSTSLFLTDISFLPGQSKVFGDNISQTSGNRFIEKTGLAFNILDTAPINIQLFISGQREDSFIVDQYWVNGYNDKKTSFEKVDGVSTRVQSNRIINAQSGVTINPGVYFSTGTVNNVAFPPAQSGENLQLPLPCVSVDQRDLIKVTEIFPGNENYPPYIELAINADLNENTLSISGDLIATGIEFGLGTGGTTLQKNSLLLISNSGFRQAEGIQSVRNDDFSLVSTGNWLLITIGSGQNRQVMDIVYLSGNTIGSSSYFAKTSYQCVRVFDSIDYFSPGFDQKFLKYFSGVTLTKIEYISIFTGNQAGTGDCLYSGQNDSFSGETINTTSISGIENQYTIRIVDIDYDPEGSDTNTEKITLLATHLSGDTAALDLSKTFRLKVNGINKTLPRILPMNIPTTFTKTFGFPNSTDNGQDIIVQLTHGEYVFDTYSYNPNKSLEDENLLTGDNESTGNSLDISGRDFFITYILPNPEGKDTKEEIGLLITGTASSGIIDLSKGFTLRRGNTKKKLSQIVYEGQENILSGNLGLLNKAACVSLFYEEQELTKFCYRIPKEGEKISTSDVGLQETTQENIDILNTLQLKKIENKLCIRYKDKSFLCKRIPASKAEIKTTQEQKLYKGFASLMKQYLISNRKSLYYDTPLKGYYDRVAIDKKLIAQGISKVDIYGQSVLVTNVKQQMEILQNTLPGIVGAFEGINGL